MAGNARDIQLKELKDTISQLNSTIKSQNELINELRKTIQANQEQIDYLTKKLFGTSSEKRKSQTEGQLSLFDEAEQEYKPDVPEVEDTTTIKEHTRKPKTTSQEKLKGIPVEEVVIDLPEDQKFCGECGSPLVRVGKEFVRQELEYIPAKVKVIRYYSTTYKCAKCSEGYTENVESYFVKSKVPEGLMPHSLASASTVAWVMYQKYGNALPLYRQESDWKQYGAALSRTTLANWIIQCSREYLQPMYDYFHRELLKRHFLMADETRIQVLKEPERDPERDSFMWLFRSGEDGLPGIILFGYTETRAKYNAANFLKGFKGYLETDGYQGYNNLPDVTRCCCWAHVRRYFIDAIPSGSENDLSHPAVQAVIYIDKLFQYERYAADHKFSYEKRYKYRLEKAAPVLEAFFKWLDSQNPLKNGRLGKAVNYALNIKPYLMTYLEDGRCSFSNNLSENAIRPFTVGRKNWLFSDTPKGAEASATVYTMVEMAKAHGLNVYEYLKYLLIHRPNKEMTDEQLEELAPWSEDAINTCKKK